ncbi:MAG: ABC transporter substrate-binding protein [Gemmatimonadetes bacterium]|nr:ABC transporter substrate-binding protein [Gemmatimonadota bacterium]
MCRRALFLIPLAAACARLPDAPGTPAAGASVILAVGVLPTHPRYERIVAGARVAVDRLNAERGLRIQLRLPPRGIGSDVALAEALRDDPAVLGVVGAPDDAAAVATLGTYADTAQGGARALPVVSPTAAGSRLAGINPWFFRVPPNTRDVARFAARWVRDSLPARRALVIYRNDAVGRDWNASFADGFAELGGTVLGRRPYLPGITEWEAYARLIVKLTPDAVFLAGDTEDLRLLQRALRAQGARVPVLGSTDAAAGAGGPAVGTDPAEAPPLRVISVGGGETAEGRAFAQRFTALHRRAPGLTEALAYDATLVLGSSVRRGGDTRARLRDLLEQTGNGAPSVQGATGLVAFRQDHDIRGRAVAVTTLGTGRP